CRRCHRRRCRISTANCVRPGVGDGPSFCFPFCRGRVFSPVREPELAFALLPTPEAAALDAGKTRFRPDLENSAVLEDVSLWRIASAPERSIYHGVCAALDIL